MTGRERVERAIRFEEPDRVPFNFWMDRRRMAELEARYGPDFRTGHFGADVVEAFLHLPFPTGTHTHDSGTAWLVEEAFTDWRDALELPLPDPDGEDCCRPVDTALEQHPDKAVILDLPNVLSVAESLRRPENVYMDLLEYPDEVSAFFHRVSDIQARAAEHACRRDITALYVMDDIGSNKGLLISPALLREMVLPHWKKVIEVGHAHGKPVFFHTDGKVDAAWDLFAEEMGIRMLNPLQPGLQDLADFKRRYHGRMGVYGGLETGLIHNLTPERLRQHVFDLFEQCGRGGGLIISSHDIDYACADANLDALAAAVRECVY